MIVEKTEKAIVVPVFNRKSSARQVASIQWQDYKWQLNNSIRTIKAFEEATGIKFSEKERRAFEKTTKKFPLCITPYYASLIEQRNYLNDPIFKQAFPNPAELKIDEYDMKDPLHEDKDSPTKGITHRYPDQGSFSGKQPLCNVLPTLYKKKKGR